MKFDTREFKSNLDKCKKAVGKNQLIPVFSMIRIDAQDNKYRMIASNSVYQMVCFGEYEGSDSFNLCFPPEKLSVAAESSGEFVDISLKNDKAIAKAGKSRFQFNTLPGEDFPIIEYNFEPAYNDNLKRMIGNIHLAAPKNHIQPALNGVSLKTIKGDIVASATDGHCIAFNSTNAESNNDLDIVIPNESISIITGFDSLGFSFNNKNSIAVSFKDGSILVSKLIDAPYPNITKFIEETYSNSFEFDSDEMISAVKLAQKIGNGDIRITIIKGDLKITSKSNDGEFETQLKVECNTDIEESFGCDLFLRLFDVIREGNNSINFTTSDQHKYMASCGQVKYIFLPRKI